MAQLPIPGGDSGTWGTILNDFLSVSLNGDGTIQATALTAAGAITSVNTLTPNSSGNVTLTAANISAVPSSQVGSPSGVASLSSSGLVPSAELGTGTANNTNFLRGDGTWITPNSGSSSLASDTDVSIVSPSNGQVLTYNSSQSKWNNETPAVASVFGRTGAVTAQTGDYTALQVGALASTDDLAIIAVNNPTSGNVSINSHKITNLTNGSASSDAAAFGQIPTSAGSIGGLLAANNLSDVSSASSARTNLGLGTAATENVGTTSGTVAAGNDSRFAGSAAGTAGASLSATDPTTTNSRAPTGTAGGDLSGSYPNPSVTKLNGDVSVPSTNPSSSGLVLTTTGSGTTTAWSSPASSLPPNGAAGGDLSGTYPNPTLSSTANVESIISANTTVAGALQSSNNLSDVASASSARTNLGLGTAATENVGTTSGTVMAGNQAAGGDLSGTLPSPTVAKLNGITAPSSAPTGSGQVLTSTSTSATAWQTPTAAPVSSVFGRTGAVTAQSGDYTAAQVTGAASTSSGSTQTFTGNVSAPAVIASGLSGATAASRYVGATTGGAPASGTFSVGDFVIDQTAKIWICTTAGTPGTWTQSSITIDGTASDIQALGSSAAAGSSGKAADAKHVHPNAGLVTAVTAGDTSIVIGGTSAAPTIETATLDVIASDHPPAASWSNNSMKITSLANGSNPQDAAAFGQIPIVDSTASDIQPLGTAAAGSSGKWADAKHVHSSAGVPVNELGPADHGLIAWNFAPYNVRSTDHTALATAGVLYGVKLVLSAATTVSNIAYNITVVGAGLTSGQCFAALYSGAGSLLSATADQSTNFAATGNHVVALSSAQAVSAGYVYVVFWFNGTTGPSFGVGDASSIGTINQSATLNLSTTFSFFSCNTGATTTGPSSLGTLASTTSYGIWVGLS